jgi:hypothetical protein
VSARTPSPWIATLPYGSSGFWYVGIKDDPDAACVCYSVEKAEANARHIAHCVNAHDELLGALRDALHYIENYPRSDHRNDPVAKAVSDGYAEVVRTAIAKAEAGNVA